ncbi:hypothetical protein T439DRAFT_337075 [Meredithblackwellia eburnea MCA 4105]
MKSLLSGVHNPPPWTRSMARREAEQAAVALASSDLRARSEHNARAPINRLPSETFDQIFCTLDESIEYDAELSKHDVLSAVSLVCRQWKKPAQRALGIQLVFNSKCMPHRWLALKPEKLVQPLSLALFGMQRELTLSVLQCCRALTKLTLVGVARLGEWSIFRIPELSNLRSLDIDEHCFLDDPADTSSLEIELEHLRLDKSLSPLFTRISPAFA